MSIAHALSLIFRSMSQIATEALDDDDEYLSSFHRDSCVLWLLSTLLQAWQSALVR